MGLTAAERKELFKQTLTGNEDNSLITSNAQEKELKEEEKVEVVSVAKAKVLAKKEKPKSPIKATTKKVKDPRISELEVFFQVSKKIREQVDEEFGSDENQLTYTTGLYPRYISILKRMSKSVGISQGAIISAALCHMLDAFPEEERSAIIKDQVNEIW